MKRLLACSILAALAAAQGALASDAAKAPTFDPHYLSQQVKTLASDAFEGRGPATADERRTVAYVISQMKAAGLQPAGALKDGKRTWTQPVPLGRFEITGKPSFSLAIGGKNEPLTQGDQIAVRAAQDGSTRVDIANAPLVFVGYGVKAPERNWDDFKGVDLHGKIAVALVNDPDFETGHGDFGGKAMTYYGRWTYKYEEIARQGALGLLIIHETAPASYGWPTVKNSNTNTQFDIVREHPAEVHSKVEGWIQRDLAVQMFKDAGLDFDALKKQAQTRDFKPLQTLEGENKTLFEKHNPGGGIPWVNFGGTHATSGASVEAEVFRDATYDTLIAGIQDPNSAIGKSIDPAINMLTAQICTLTQGQPTNVCTTKGVMAAAPLLAK